MTHLLNQGEVIFMSKLLKYRGFSYSALISMCIFLSGITGGSAFGAVDDNGDKLEWDLIDSQPFSYTGAKDFCERKPIAASGARWRLPTIREIESIYLEKLGSIANVYDRRNEAVKLGLTQWYGGVWASPSVKDDNLYYYFLLGQGMYQGCYKDHLPDSSCNTEMKYQALCVKSEPPIKCTRLPKFEQNKEIEFKAGVYCDLRGFSEGGDKICMFGKTDSPVQVRFFQGRIKNSRNSLHGVTNSYPGMEWAPQEYFGFQTNGVVLMKRCTSAPEYKKNY